jgi:hypothetical protein
MASGKLEVDLPGLDDEDIGGAFAKNMGRAGSARETAAGALWEV